MCKLAVGVTTPIPILPSVFGVMLGLPVIVLYVLIPYNTLPIFKLFVVPADNVMFVPIIILFEPTLSLGKTA